MISIDLILDKIKIFLPKTDKRKRNPVQKSELKSFFRQLIFDLSYQSRFWSKALICLPEMFS
jgi:hypothetical protein